MNDDLFEDVLKLTNRKVTCFIFRNLSNIYSTASVVISLGLFHVYSFSVAIFSKEKTNYISASLYEKGSVFTFQVIMHHQYLFRARRDELLPSLVRKSETCLWNAAYPDPQLNWKRDACLRARNLQVGSVSESVIEYIQKRLIAPGAVGRKTIEASNVSLASLQQMG